MTSAMTPQSTFFMKIWTNELRGGTSPQLTVSNAMKKAQQWKPSVQRQEQEAAR
jgi:hypothetical protein